MHSCLCCGCATDRVQPLNSTGVEHPVCSRFCAAELHASRQLRVGNDQSDPISALQDQLDVLLRERNATESRVQGLAVFGQTQQTRYHDSSMATERARAALNQAVTAEGQARRMAFLARESLKDAQDELRALDNRISQLRRRIALMQQEPSDPGMRKRRVDA